MLFCLNIEKFNNEYSANKRFRAKILHHIEAKGLKSYQMQFSSLLSKSHIHIQDFSYDIAFVTKARRTFTLLK